MLRDKSEKYISGTEIAEICKRLGQQIEKDYKGKDLLVLCVLKGSVVFAADLVRCINLPLEIDFVRLSSYGNRTVSSGQVRIIKDVSARLTGRHVLIVEDILDTGHTMHFFKQHLLSSKPASIKICCLLDKPSRRHMRDVTADYCGRAIDDHFVIGYGLDFQEKCRNYSDILYVRT